MQKYTKEELNKEILNLLVVKYGADEDEVSESSLLGDDLNLGPSEIQELILDLCEKHGADYEEVLSSIDEELEDLSVNELVDYLADSFKFD